MFLLNGAAGPKVGELHARFSLVEAPLRGEFKVKTCARDLIFVRFEIGSVGFGKLDPQNVACTSTRSSGAMGKFPLCTVAMIVRGHAVRRLPAPKFRVSCVRSTPSPRAGSRGPTQHNEFLSPQEKNALPVRKKERSPKC